MINQMALEQAQKRRKALIQVFAETQVKPGWIKYIRSLFGMTLKELAKLTNLSLPSVAQAEKREEKGHITLETLRKMANAMECEFVYAFIPREEIPLLLKKKALENARKSKIQADTHMTLENQKVESDIEERIERLANELFKKGKIW